MKKYKNILSFEEETKLRKQLNGLKSVRARLVNKFIATKDKKYKEQMIEISNKVNDLAKRIELSRTERLESELNK